MPFVVRKVEPRFVCRGHVPTGASRDWPVGAELEAAANGALTASLKQLASLLVAAEDIFAELTTELAGIAERSGKLRTRLDRVEDRLALQDPKKIPVPESDICTFALRTDHFRLTNEPEKCLFTLDTRPKALRQLYEAAAAAAVRSLDSIRRDRDATTSMDMFMCTPILGKRRRDHSLDIESRVPRAIEELRRWTSAEALGDVTVAPDCMSRILGETADDSQAVDHKLPSPEEQLQAIALKFPAEIVAVDVSGRGFQRMSMRRRSMHTGQESQEPVKRRSRPRRPRGKRRNTIAGTDQKEIRQAVGGEEMVDEREESHASTGPSKRAHRSASTDLLGSGRKKDSPIEKKSHFNTLKAWGRSRLKLISPKSSHQQQNHVCADINGSTASLANGSATDQRTCKQQQQQQQPEDEIRSTEEELHEGPPTGTRRLRREVPKSSHERKPSSSSSSGKSTASLGAVASKQKLQQQQQQQQQQEQLVGAKGGDQLERPGAQQTSRPSSVKLRESAAERRERRKASSRADEPPHSSSGNWSASSESGRASIGSETTTTTHPPRSTTTASIGTSSTSLSQVRRLKGRDTSASSSVTSEGTLTPDIIQDISTVPFSDDGETSSVYSCDTEGYYTSFHMDSGLKTLREEEPPQPPSPLTKTNELQSDPTSPLVENEYELFGRGSTSTTTSSAGTVCTTLMAPPPPERKSSLTVVAMVHGQNKNGGESPDSGHNTSSSPVESASSPACTGRSCSEFEYSESSDLEGCERIERIRSKTAINTSRIPSMCVITPPNSDDEHHHQRHKDAAAKEPKPRKDRDPGSILMSATVGTSKMEVINGQDKNLYATVQTVMAPSEKAVPNTKISPLSGVLGKLRGVLPGRKNQQKSNPNQDANHQLQQQQQQMLEAGDYVTIADVRNNNDKRQQNNVRSGGVTYANADLYKREAEYVSLSELPKKPDSSLERRRQGARVTLDSEGKVVYSSDSLKRRKGAHTTFIPGPFVKEGASSPAPSPLLRRTQVTPRAVQRTTSDAVDGDAQANSELPMSQQQQQPGKVIIRAAKSPERASSPDYVRMPATVVGPGVASGGQRQGAYVNVQGGGEDKTLLVIQPNEPVSSSACPQQQQQQPPPYVGPPQVQNINDDYSYQVVYDNRSQKNSLSNNQVHQQQQQHNYHQHHHRQVYQQQQLNIHQISDPYQQILYEKNNRYHHHHCHQPYSNYTENQKMYAHQLHNPIQNCEKNQQQFYTLPNRRTNREVIIEPPRSITPDITRGLARGPLSAMHMLAKQGQKSDLSEKLVGHHHGQADHNCQIDLNRKNLEQFEARCKLAAQEQQKHVPVDVKNRFASPLGLSALGYRFFASPIQDNLKTAPLSPIGPEHANGFKSSTPTGRATPTVAERLALQTQRCVSPNPALLRHATSEKQLLASPPCDSGRSTPTGLVLSPIKSTMSNEELFAAIHKSKRRLNIRDDPESLSPAGSLTSLAKGQQTIGTRHSWSPESQKTPEIPKTVLSLSTTSRMDFKRLLLQQSIKAGPTRISAAEQLKLSRQQCQESHQQQHHQQQQQQQHHQQQQYSPVSSKLGQQTALTKVLSPRSAWRFQTPRTDVLSSTIIEDAAAEEKAMKPSPENPLPAPRLALTAVRRQLDVTETQRPTLEKCDKELENRLQVVDAMRMPSEASNPIKAIESRRMSNQLARAQFLAGSASPSTTKDLFGKRFRARSESPQQTAQRALPGAVTQVPGATVTRSPSAPTLETAL